MKVYDNFKSKNIDQLVDWLDECVSYDDSPWITWFDKKYCSKCVPKISDEYTDKCGWCELHNGKCKYFKELDSAPDNKQMIKMWLESEDDID